MAQTGKSAGTHRKCHSAETSVPWLTSTHPNSAQCSLARRMRPGVRQCLPRWDRLCFPCGVLPIVVGLQRGKCHSAGPSLNGQISGELFRINRQNTICFELSGISQFLVPG